MKIFCEVCECKIDGDDPCKYQQGIVKDTSIICVRCDRYKKLKYEEEIKRLRTAKPEPSKKLPRKTDPTKKKFKKAFSKVLKEKAPYPKSHLLDFLETTGIDIMFPDPAGHLSRWSVDSYLNNKYRNQAKAPFRLIDAIDEENYLQLRISLNHKEGPMRENFSKLLTTAYDELKKHGKERFKISERQYRDYLRVHKHGASPGDKKEKRIERELKKLMS